MKIAYCIPALYTPSGMERVLTLKANYFAEKLNHDITIILSDSGERPPYYELSPKIKLVYLNIDFDRMYSMPMYKRIPYYMRMQRLFKKKLTDALLLLKPDITISLLRREINFLNSIQDGSRKMGEIHFDRENYRSLRGEKARNPIEVLMAKFWMAKLIKELKKLERFIVLTKEDQKKWTELSNTTVIYNPLPFKQEVVSDCSAKQVILVGRYTHQKGIDMMIQTWKFVAEKHPDWTLKVYGAGDRTSYQKLVDEAGIGGSVCLEGPTPDIEAKYLESSIFVLSSRHEGFGMVLIEAMACGLPVVSFTCPCGPRDIVTEGKDGFLVDLGDVKALAEKICVLIEDEALRKEMGVNARMNIDRFDLDKIAQQWENVFSYKK